MKTFKKLLAVLLSLTMVFGTLTVTASGEEWKEVNTNITSNDHDMWNMQSGQEYFLKLTKNIYSNKAYWLKVPEGVVCHLDLNGYQLQKNSAYANCVENNGTLIVTNSGAVGKGIIYNKIDPSTGSTPAITNNGTLIMSNTYVYQTYSTSPSTEPGAIVNNGTLKLQNCIIGGRLINNGTVKGFQTVGGVDTDTEGLVDGFYFENIAGICTGYSTVLTTFPKYGNAPYVVVADTDTFSISFVDTKSETTTDGDTFPAAATPLCKDGYTLDTPVKAGFEFVEWNTAADRSGKDFAAGTKITGIKDEIITLYAIWRSTVTEKHTISFMNGEKEVTSYTDFVGEKVTAPTLDNDNTVLTGAFAGWKDADGNVYAGGAEITIEKDTVFTPVWKNFGVEATVNETTQYFSDLAEATKTVITTSLTSNTKVNFKLLSDFVLEKYISFSAKQGSASGDTIKKIYTLDFNGHTISITGDFTNNGDSYGKAVFISNQTSELHFTDTSTDANGGIDATGENSANFVYINGYTSKVYYEGGVFTGDNGFCTNMGNVGNGGGAYITGGVFHNTAFTDDASHLRITGGTFDIDPTTHVLDGYQAKDNQDGTWSVIPNPPVAEITVDSVTTQYPTLSEAIIAARDIAGATVKIIGDFTLNSAVLASWSTDVGKVMTIDLNGHTITCTKNFIGTHGTLYITDSSEDGTGKVVYKGTLTADEFGSGKTYNLSYGHNFISLRYWNSSDCPAGTIYLNGGTIVDESETGHPFGLVGNSSGAYSTFHLNGGKIIAKEGKYAVYGGVGVINSNGTDIEGNVYLGNGGTYNFTNGKLDGEFVTTGTNYNMTITGGEYSFDPSAYVPTGYIVIPDDKTPTEIWTVDKANVEVEGTISDSVSFSIYADERLGDNVKLKYSFGTTEKTVEPEQGKFEITGIPFFQMANTIKLAIIDGDNKEVWTDETSIVEYLNAVHESDPTDNALNIIIAQTLALGQELLGMDPALGTAISIPEWAEEFVLDVTPAETDSVRKIVKTGSADAKIKGAALVLKDKVGIVFYLDLKTGETATVTRVDGAEELPVVEFTATEDVKDYELRIEKQSPLTYADEYIIRTSGGGEVHYSINSYCVSKQAEKTVGAAALAIFRYGVAANNALEE